LRNKSCPLNKIVVANTTYFPPNTAYNQTIMSKKFTAFNFQRYPNSSPIAELFISPSQPCRDRGQTYMQRESKIQDIYREEILSCKFKSNEKSHTDFSKTGFFVKEFTVYSQNNLIDSIKSKVPKFSQSELELNSYFMFQKPYSMWSSSCQREYTSEEIAELG
jgi:hypothetical protein